MGFEQVLLRVFAEADYGFGEVVRLRLFDLPDIEVDKAHCQHVVGEEGKLVLSLLVVNPKRIP